MSLIVGDKYDRSRDVKEVAVLVRKELAEKFPKSDGYKFRVKISRFAGGQSCDVTILDCSFSVYTQKSAAWEHFRPDDDREYRGCVSRFNARAQHFHQTVDSILNRYNRRDVDSSTDYWNVDYYGHVSWSSGLVTRGRAEALRHWFAAFLYDCPTGNEDPYIHEGFFREASHGEGVSDWGREALNPDYKHGSCKEIC